MDQRTHAWIAIRAVALLDDEGACPNLVKLLKPYLHAAAVGSWIPDKRDAKIGGSDTDNHILKMEPYRGEQVARFTLTKPELLKKLGKHRVMSTFLAENASLDDSWWKTPYKANPQPGQHIADRAGALTTTIIDLLIMGNQELATLIPNRYQFAEELEPKARSQAEQAALYFYMQSHFIADASMPCHCDARKLSSYGNGLHKELESHWSQKIGVYFDDKRLESTTDPPATILGNAKAVDTTFSITFKNEVPQLNERDVWLETIYICRGSFAVASIIAPPESHGYGQETLAPFNTVLEQRPELLRKVDEVALHDAVLNVAITWKHLWNQLQKKSEK